VVASERSVVTAAFARRATHSAGNVATADDAERSAAIAES
jgi:hypothetical protein